MAEYLHKYSEMASFGWKMADGQTLADKTEEDLIILVKKPNTTSIVWNYFGLEANEGGTLTSNLRNAVWRYVLC